MPDNITTLIAGLTKQTTAGHLVWGLAERPILGPDTSSLTATLKGQEIALCHVASRDTFELHVRNYGEWQLISDNRAGLAKLFQAATKRYR